MKNISKTIAAFSLSLLTIGAMAQVQSNNAHPNLSKLKTAVGPSLQHSSHLTGNVNYKTTSMQIFYPNTDGGIFNNAYSVNGLSAWFVDKINGRYNESDTGASNTNQSLIHSASVAFDTILDGAAVAHVAKAGTMKVDTLWALIGYKNTSGMNDTLVFSINTVDVNGVPTLTSLTTVKVPLYKDVMFGTNRISGLNLDSLNYAYCIPNFTIAAGTRFSVNVTFLGSKADTFELGYGFPYATCTPYDYANTFTVCGLKYTGTRTINVNSYFWGFQEFFTNTPTMIPSADGSIFSAGNYEWNVCPSAPTDTMFLYEQDYAIAASVTFSDITGVNNIAASGLSVGQNYPNPFNKETTISYSLTKSSDVTFSVYDITGRVITTNSYGTVAPGQYTINLSANSFKPGIYFYTFNVNGSTTTKKMVITE